MAGPNFAELLRNLGLPGNHEEEFPGAMALEMGRANAARHGRGALPVMSATLPDRSAITRAHDFGLSQNLESKEGNSTMRVTMLAAITHGVAPAIDGLTPILLGEAITAVNKIHTGRVMYLTSVSTAFRTVGVAVLADDSKGDRIVLQLYNYVRSHEVPAEIFPPGTRIAMLEPYLRFPRDDPANSMIFLRCDNPQAVRVFPSDAAWRRAQRGDFSPEAEPTGLSADALCDQGNVLWFSDQSLGFGDTQVIATGAGADPLFPAGLIPRPSPPCRHQLNTAALSLSLSLSLFLAGNKHFAAGRFAEAARIYTSALMRDPVLVRALANRGACRMQEKRWGAALEDAAAALAVDVSHKKAAYRFPRTSLRLFLYRSQA
jgi:hypothetical protein